MGRHLDEGPRGSGVQVIFVSEIARSTTVLHQPLIEPDDVKWRIAGQGATTVLNCAAQADIVRPFADNSIGEELDGFSVAEEFKRPVRINGEMAPGIHWELVTKPPGSRVTGFALMRERLIAASPRPDSKIREAPGLFVVEEHCPQFKRTVPVLPRSKKNQDDIDTASEDHIYDAARYMLQSDRSPHVSFGRRQIW
jgi:hypothetical protein